MLTPFTFNSNPGLIFGNGTFGKLPETIKRYGKRVLLITGSRSFQNSKHHDFLLSEFKKSGIQSTSVSLEQEPSPEWVDKIVLAHKDVPLDVIAAIGGGSVIDAGKAVSAMLSREDSVFDYLEGVGTKTHNGEKLPFIAIPTTAGTGSEATKNAVLSRIGPHGFKKSLRHDNFVPNVAIVDPLLTLSCPAKITASCGLDAFTQLLESYTSPKASPMTDALAFMGLEAICSDAALNWADAQNINARSKMAFASYLSGLTLANAGLGVVHGFASVIGGYFNMPHGMICGTLISSATKFNIDHLKKNNPTSPALKKYAKAGSLLNGSSFADQDIHYSRLVETLEKWIKDLKIPLLSDFGVGINHIEKIVEKTSIKNNPALLSKQELRDILLTRII
ncbi:MAG: iron-containing alcohol dehydrogenase [Proteobacteria bacterium]|nr:iron-containing alcohol dehydrogenase [Pseudomonadota bacterium]MBU1581962.1 iron-containing alcohol dehydrogenase [Pseudomonadota bacterium]MBU2455194.1 iron-containing alcohol dehydrogenase [Pseudomonadota bacterium]MBU2627420.1 iron-containing alcohol dehydrogenase [Pseudomonadota bacterium]